jgi:predicted GIY-YIG superfamily endonuclease
LIYKLVCSDPTITEIYVGSTTNFNERKRGHKKTCYTEINKD